MKTVTLTREAVHNGSLILVNKDNPICGGHWEGSLIPLSDKNNGVFMEARAATVLRKLMSDLNCEDKIIAASGFRSRDEQTRLYETSLAQNGAEFTAKYVARPNHSEHQTGLAVDMALNQPNIDTIRPHFPYTGICGAFRAKAVKFGFTERYPKGKEHITGIAHEPWHFRYVGSPHSKIMQELSLTLEEYIVHLKGLSCGGKSFRYNLDDLTVEVYYHAANEDITRIEIDTATPYSISGDNMGGFIVTTWHGIGYV